MLVDKVIVVTGGAGLLGAAFCKAISSNGGTAIIADIDIEASKRVKDRIDSCGLPGVVDCTVMDITDSKSIEQTILEIVKSHGRIDSLVNNAYPRNKHYGREVLNVSYHDFCENMSLNLGGYFNTTQQFVKYFLEQGYGNIVNMSSIYGVVAPDFAIYNGTQMTMPVEYSVIKSGVLHLTKYFAKYLKGKNIRVNAISPGGIFDNQPGSFLEAYKANCLNKGMLDKEDLVGTLIYLLSDMSSYVNGQNVIVDDGFSI